MGEHKFVELEERADVLILSPRRTFGQLLNPEAAREWKEVLDRLDAPDIRRVVVDLAELPYFGSTVLDCLVQLWNRMKAKRGAMATCNVSAVGREVLSLARLDTLWQVFPTPQEALAELRPAGQAQSSPSQG